MIAYARVTRRMLALAKFTALSSEERATALDALT